MDIRQVLWRRRDGTLILDLPHWFRGVLALIACGLVALMISDGRVYPLPIVLLLASGLGALYTQGWEFNPRTGRILNRHGLLVWARTTEYSASEVDAVVVDGFSPGAGTRKRFVRLKLLLRDGSSPVVEVQRRRGSELPRNAKLIAAAMNLRIEGDAPQGADEEA